MTMTILRTLTKAMTLQFEDYICAALASIKHDDFVAKNDKESVSIAGSGRDRPLPAESKMIQHSYLTLYPPPCTCRDAL